MMVVFGACHTAAVTGLQSAEGPMSSDRCWMWPSSRSSAFQGLRLNSTDTHTHTHARTHTHMDIHMHGWLRQGSSYCPGQLRREKLWSLARSKHQAVAQHVTTSAEREMKRKSVCVRERGRYSERWKERECEREREREIEEVLNIRVLLNMSPHQGRGDERQCVCERGGQRWSVIDHESPKHQIPLQYVATGKTGLRKRQTESKRKNKRHGRRAQI